MSFIFCVQTTCTELTSLTLGATTDSIIRTIVTRNRGLEQLSIYCSSKFSSKGVKVIAENCPILKGLKLKCSVRMSDKSIEPILKYCTALEELSLFSCSKVKGECHNHHHNTPQHSLTRSLSLGVVFKKYPGKAAKKGSPFCLRNLDLSYCELSKTGFKALVKVHNTLLHNSPLAHSPTHYFK